METSHGDKFANVGYSLKNDSNAYHEKLKGRITSGWRHRV